ncbi:MAG TPA: glycosyltransferase [Verrucomicrobiae bacterium]|nr:glycosyltransferase [Verrucomicrobiae bacterium]
MIYLDVTDSCKSPLNTGIQRVVRGLFRALCYANLPVTPMLWEPGLGSYCALSARERGFLEAPFAARNRKALAQPARAANPIPVWSKFARQLTHRRNRLDLAARLEKNDSILVPQIFRDGRGACVASLGRQSGAQTIAFFYDAIPWRRPDVTPPSNVKGVVDYMMALAKFDLIITSSREAAGDLRACWELHDNGMKQPPIHIMAWPPDETFNATDQTTAPSAPRTGARRKIICVGTLEPRKNHLTLLAAAEKLWREHRLDFQLELIGRTTRECGPRVLAEVERLHKARWPVHWRRHVDNESLLAAYDECAFTVFPSLVEGYGLPIVESLMRGRPCVCGGNGALGELAAGGGCLIVDQTDVTALAEGMKRLLADADIYERLSAEARARRFESWPDFVEKLTEILRFQRTEK